MTGWRKRKKGGWRRAYAVVTATGVTFDAAAAELRYAVVQFLGQAGVTKGFRGGGEGGARREALRFCTVLARVCSAGGDSPLHGVCYPGNW